MPRSVHYLHVVRGELGPYGTIPLLMDGWSWNFSYRSDAEEKRCVMQITRQADYAVRALTYLSGLPLGQQATTATISETQAVPRPFLSKVISQLALAGLVVTTRGMGGGVSLARRPEEITLLQVVEAVDGPVRVNQCLLRSGNCQLESVCGAHDVWTQIQGRLIQDMEAVTMQELARREMEKGGNNTGQ
jgi:Rrf2 family protein